VDAVSGAVVIFDWRTHVGGKGVLPVAARICVACQ
jgi:hypothetical protein